jgi:hypothetical protein
MDCCESLVQWSSQGKKSPYRRLFDVLCAERNKLLAFAYSGGQNVSGVNRGK